MDVWKWDDLDVLITDTLQCSLSYYIISKYYNSHNDSVLRTYIEFVNVNIFKGDNLHSLSHIWVFKFDEDGAAGKVSRPSKILGFTRP